MSRTESLHRVSLPRGVSVDQIMRTLEIGLGYRWDILVDVPRLVAHGSPPGGRLPEILIEGPRSMVLSAAEGTTIERVRLLLQLLARRKRLLPIGGE
ncbi:MAG: hypothetical protein ACTSVD_00250 [Candidatus Thorarchaeota archaeon]|nr:MAG: hypothetical protein DRO73_09410 [Candidatus Thorarchaeota archaeon]RLI60319.1 MAG: hypothetical protein DRO93_07375 [Candidatus Thorarchaeota archaeon]